MTSQPNPTTGQWHVVVILTDVNKPFPGSYVLWSNTSPWFMNRSMTHLPHSDTGQLYVILILTQISDTSPWFLTQVNNKSQWHWRRTLLLLVFQGRGEGWSSGPVGHSVPSTDWCSDTHATWTSRPSWRRCSASSIWTVRLALAS